MEIRVIRPEEYRVAGSVTARAFAEFAPPDDGGWKEFLGLIADVRGRIERTVVLVAVDGGRVVGSVTIELDGTVGDEVAELPPDVACIRMLGVDPSVRRRGIGRGLARAVIDRAREAGRVSWSCTRLPSSERRTTCTSRWASSEIRATTSRPTDTPRIG